MLIVIHNNLKNKKIKTILIVIQNFHPRAQNFHLLARLWIFPCPASSPKLKKQTPPSPSPSPSHPFSLSPSISDSLFLKIKIHKLVKGSHPCFSCLTLTISLSLFRQLTRLPTAWQRFGRSVWSQVVGGWDYR